MGEGEGEADMERKENDHKGWIFVFGLADSSQVVRYGHSLTLNFVADDMERSCRTGEHPVFCRRRGRIQKSGSTVD